MKRRSTVLAAYGVIAILLSAVTGVSAQSASKVLTTPPLFVVGGDSIACEVANVGGTQVWVTISVINSLGETVDSNLAPLAAGASTENDYLVPEDAGTRYYCKFECSGTGCDLRGAIARFTGGSDISGYPAKGSDL